MVIFLVWRDREQRDVVCLAARRQLDAQGHCTGCASCVNNSTGCSLPAPTNICPTHPLLCEHENIFKGCTSCLVTLSIQLPPGSQADNISLLPISPHKEDHHRLTIIDSKLKFMIRVGKMCTF